MCINQLATVLMPLPEGFFLYNVPPSLLQFYPPLMAPLFQIIVLHILSFFKKKYFVFIYLTVPGLSCGTWDLRFSLRHAGSLVASCRIQFPNQGLNPGPLHWDHEILATGPLGKSLSYTFFSFPTLQYFVFTSHIFFSLLPRLAISYMDHVNSLI